MKYDKYTWNPGDIEIDEPEKETPVDKAIKEIVKIYVSDKRNKKNVK